MPKPTSMRLPDETKRRIDILEPDETRTGGVVKIVDRDYAAMKAVATDGIATRAGAARILASLGDAK